MPNLHPTQEQGQRHLERIQALIEAITSAISAIEHNELPKLQAAIARQEQLCSELASTRWTRPQLEISELGKQIRASYAALVQLNRVYAGLVKRSKRSNELLSMLYGIPGEDYGKRPVPTPHVRTLSCEV